MATVAAVTGMRFTRARSLWKRAHQETSCTFSTQEGECQKGRMPVYGLNFE